MKKTFITAIFFMLSSFLFANFNDNLNILKEEDKQNINEKIDALAKEKNINVFVNTLAMGEGFAISDPELAVILNLKKVENSKKFEVELSFSKDIDIEEHKDEVEEVLASTEELLKQEEYAKYIIATLDGIRNILQDVEIEQLNQMTMTQEQEESGNNIFVGLGIVLMIFLGMGTIFYRLRKLDTSSEKEEKK